MDIVDIRAPPVEGQCGRRGEGGGRRVGACGRKGACGPVSALPYRDWSAQEVKNPAWRTKVAQAWLKDSDGRYKFSLKGPAEEAGQLPRAPHWLAADIRRTVGLVQAKLKRLVTCFRATQPVFAFSDLMLQFELGRPDRGRRRYSARKDNLVQAMLRAVGEKVVAELGATVLTSLVPSQ